MAKKLKKLYTEEDMHAMWQMAVYWARRHPEAPKVRGRLDSLDKFDLELEKAFDNAMLQLDE